MAGTGVLPGRNPLQGVTTAIPRGVIGSSFPELNQAATFKRKQAFSISGHGSVRLCGDVRTKGAGGELDSAAFKATSVDTISESNPEWTTLSQKVLRFFAYYREPVHEMRHESERVRQLVVLYYLEDDTIQISEPRQNNSGIVQGGLVKRHQVQRASGGGTYTVDDLRVGDTLAVYGKTLVLHDCDAFTRRFYEGLNRPQQARTGVPGDAHTQQRELLAQRGPKDAELRRVMNLDASQMTGGTVHRIAPEERANTHAFFRNDNKVLRYYCSWQDPSAKGTAHRFRLLFFQVDGTCVLSEEITSNSGKDPVPTFLRRQRIPKPGTGRSPYAPTSMETVSCKPEDEAECYGEADFAVGNTVMVYGRSLVICDMDESTKRYHAERGTGGAVNGTIEPLPLPDQVVYEGSVGGGAKAAKAAAAAVASSQPPPYNGFGSEEDSLGSWRNLVMRPPRRDCAKELSNRDKVLRYGAEMVSGHPTDKGRHFILSYFLADNTLQVRPHAHTAPLAHTYPSPPQIYEQSQPNSGMIAGKFLSRQPIRTSPPHVAAEYLQPTALYLGAEVDVFKTRFRLTHTDERTVALMEGHDRVFSVASVQEILKKLRDFVALRHSQIADAFRAFDRDHGGGITADELKQVLVDQQIDVSDHEVLTLMRHFDQDGDGVISFTEFVACMVPSDLSSQLDSDGGGAPALLTAEQDPTRYDQAQRTVANKRVSAKVHRMLADKLASRSVAVQDAFHMVARGSTNGCLTEDAFQDSVTNVLQLNLSQLEMEALMWLFFYDPRQKVKKSRITLPEFVRALEAAPGR